MTGVYVTGAGTRVPVSELGRLTTVGQLICAAGPSLRDDDKPEPRRVKRPARPQRRARYYRPSEEVRADLERAERHAADLTRRVDAQRAKGARMMSAESYEALYEREAAARMKAARLRRTYENALEREKTA